MNVPADADTESEHAVRRFGLLLSVLFACVFGVVYGGADALTPHIPYRLHVDLPFESGLPFMPWLAPLYLSILPVLALASWLLNSRRELLALFLTLCGETLVAGFCFVVLPVEGGFDETSSSGTWAPFALADALNLDYNWLPSLHVAFAVSAAAVYARERTPALRLGLFTWAAAVAASTVLLHQHHLADVAGGILLALAALTWIHRPALRPEIYQALVVEGLAAREMARFGRRHRRYWLIAAVIYWASLFGIRRRRVLRTGFSALQLVDDLLDGDRFSEREPLEITDDLVAEIKSRDFGTSPRSQLTAALVADLEPLAGPDRDPVAELVELIHTMQVDRRRVLQQRLLSAAELHDHLCETFRLSLDLLLVALGSALRGDSVPELLDALAWCSVARDLREDLDAGLVNVPREILEAAKREGAEDLSYESLTATTIVGRWREEERKRAETLARRAVARLKNEPDGAGTEVLLRFARSVARLAKPGVLVDIEK